MLCSAFNISTLYYSIKIWKFIRVYYGFEHQFWLVEVEREGYLREARPYRYILYLNKAV